MKGKKLAGARKARYSRAMSSDRAPSSLRQLWQPHPDDAEDVAQAMEAANRDEFLSPEASESFVRWLEGSGDDSWRVELE